MREKMIVAGLLVVVSFSGVPGSAEASLGSMEDEKRQVEDRLVEIEMEREEIKEGLSELESQLGQLLVEKKDKEEEIDRLDRGIWANERRMELLEEEIDEMTVKLDAMEKEIKELKISLEERFSEVQERAKVYQKDRGVMRLLDVVIGSDSLGEMLSGFFAITKIDEADNDFIKEMTSDQELLDRLTGEMEERLTEVNKRKVEVEGIKMYMEEQRERAVELKLEVEEKEAAIERVMADMRSDEHMLSVEETDFEKRVVTIEKQMKAERERIEEQRRIEAERKRQEELRRSQVSASGVSNGNDVTQVGRKYIGNSTYVFGGGRNNADIVAGRFDCSSFVAWSFQQVGLSVPNTTDGLINAGQRIASSEKQRGDLVFFDTYKRNGHVGIYLGNGTFLGAQSSTGVAVADMSIGYWAQKYNGNVVRVN